MATAPRVVLASGREKRVRSGHPWVFATEVADITGRYEPGDVIDVVTARGGFVGRGYINPASQIIVRLLTRRPEEAVDEDFWRRRVREAVAYRRAVFAAPVGPAATAGLSQARAGLPADIGDRAFRLVFAEADYLPALVVDYFAGYLVFQALALGVDVVKDLLLRLVREEAEAAGFPVRGIYERDDAPVRQLEGLPLRAGVFWGEVPPRVTVRENEVSLIVDVAAGQKTGYFLDQRENRAAIAPYVRAAGARMGMTAGAPMGDASGARARGGARVLDCFCYTGGFALSAAAYGASEVLGVDASAEAIALARENAALNGFAPGPAGPEAPAGAPASAGPEAPEGAPASVGPEAPAGCQAPAGREAPVSPEAPPSAASPRISFIEANVFDFLREAGARGESWDVVILDPPAFAKNKAALPGALRGYKEINLRAMKLVPPGGYLITSSCSQHVSEDLFRDMLASAAADTKRRLRVVETRSQAKDHPTLPAAPETRYLKFFVLRLE